MQWTKYLYSLRSYGHLSFSRLLRKLSQRLEMKMPSAKQKAFCQSDPVWIRTKDLLLRRQLLYPTELRDRFVVKRKITTSVIKKGGWLLIPLLSGRQDSNLRPPGPKPGAMTGLRYAPNWSSIRSFVAVGARFELAVQLPVRQFSKLLVSATHPSHHVFNERMAKVQKHSVFQSFSLIFFNRCR